MFGGLVTLSLYELFGGAAVIVPSYADSFLWYLASVEYYTAYLWLTLLLFIPATIALLLYKWINKWVFWGIMAVVFAVEIFMRISYDKYSPPEWILF